LRTASTGPAKSTTPKKSLAWDLDDLHDRGLLIEKNINKAIRLLTVHDQFARTDGDHDAVTHHSMVWPCSPIGGGGLRNAKIAMASLSRWIRVRSILAPRLTAGLLTYSGAHLLAIYVNF